MQINGIKLLVIKKRNIKLKNLRKIRIKTNSFNLGKQQQQQHEL